MLSTAREGWLIDRVVVSCTVPQHKICHFGDVPQANLLAWHGKTKPNTTKDTFTNQKKCTTSTTQNKHRKLKSGLVASCDIRPENGEDLFFYRRFINLSLTYLLRYLLTYLQPRDQHRDGVYSQLNFWWPIVMFRIIPHKYWFNGQGWQFHRLPLWTVI